jgi:hypothetical protein
MRRYDIMSGILLILSIIDFALAAPVLVQEKRQASIVVQHLPKDVITVLGKRMDEEDLAEKLWEEYFDNLGHLEESGNLKESGDLESGSDTDSSSSSASSEPGHGSTNVAQAPPPPNPASSTADPHPWGDVYSYKGNDELHGPLYTPTPSAYASSGYSSDEEFAKAHAHAPEPNSNPWPSTDSEDSDSSTDPGLDWNYWVNSEDPLAPPPRPASPNEFGRANERQAENSPSPNLGYIDTTSHHV